MITGVRGKWGEVEEGQEGINGDKWKLNLGW